MAREIVAGDGITAAPIELVPRAPRLLFRLFAADDLEQALEAREVGRGVDAEIEEERAVGRDVVVDIATLTGACVIALGHVASGLFSNDQKLADEVREAADDAWDRVWQLPLWEDYQEQLRSNFADFANVGGRPGGAITAASFLARFTRNLRWAHLDVAGTAWRSGREKGSTGRPVPLLVRYVLRHAGRK